MNKRLILIFLALVCLFALIPATAGLAVSDTTGCIHVDFTNDVGYEDSFTYIRELAAIVFPGQTAEECGNAICFFANGVQFYKVDAQTISEKLTAVKAKSYVKSADDEPVSLTDDMILCGDLNGDGSLEAVDYILTKKIVLGSASATMSQMYAADANSDRTVDAVDYLLIKKCVLGTAELSGKPRYWSAPFTSKPDVFIPDDPTSDEVSDEPSMLPPSSEVSNESSETSSTVSTKPGDNELPIIKIP